MDRTRLDQASSRVGEAACLLFLFSAPLSIALNNIALAVVGPAAFLFLLTSGKADAWRGLAPRGSLSTGIAFTLITTASAILAEDRTQAFTHLLLAPLVVMVPLAFMPFAKSPMIKRYWTIILPLGIAAGLFVMSIKGANPTTKFPRYHPSMGIMNYGGAMALLFPFILGNLIAASANGERKREWLLSLAIAGATLGALFNGTRIVWLSITVTTLFLILVNLRSITWRLGSITLILIAGVTIFFFLNPLYNDRLTSISPWFHTRVQQADQAPTPSSADANEHLARLRSSLMQANARSNNTRILLWRKAMDRLPDIPILGYGPGCCPEPILTEADRQPGMKPPLGGNYHNTFLNVALETGFPGLAALLALLAPSLILAMRNLRSPDPERRHQSRILLALLLTFCLHAMTDHLFRIKTTLQLFGFLVVLCWAYLRNPEETVTSLPQGNQE